jgi:hypothetical protein
MEQKYPFAPFRQGNQRALERVGGHQAAVLAKGAELDAVQQLFGAAENFLQSDRGVLPTKPDQHFLSDQKMSVR